MGRWLPTRGTCTQSPGTSLPPFPSAERVQERLLRSGREGLSREAPSELRGLSHLRQVDATRRTVAEVHLEARPHRRRQRVLEVVRDQLDELLAAQVVRVDDHAWSRSSIE